MKVKWLGHASFLLTSKEGLRVISDPYSREPWEGLNYDEIEEEADIVLVSHEHFDHNNTSAVKGEPETIRGAGIHQARGLEFKGVSSFHDTSEGKERGPNTIFCFTLDGIRLCHAGDLGHILSEKQVAEIGEVDVLFPPVGGFFTIDAKEATQVIEQLRPRLVIPMHFKTPKCRLPISSVEDFLKGKERVRKVGESEVELESSELPEPTEFWVLEPAL